MTAGAPTSGHLSVCLSVSLCLSVCLSVRLALFKWTVYIIVMEMNMTGGMTEPSLFHSMSKRIQSLLVVGEEIRRTDQIDRE